MNIAIVGATGNVGRKILEVLERKKLPINELFLVASPRSAGQKINFNGKGHEVFNLETFDFSKAQISSVYDTRPLTTAQCARITTDSTREIYQCGKPKHHVSTPPLHPSLQTRPANRS